MFYDVDILRRRGGKFGLIWLVAHEKLKLEKGRCDRKDIGKILNVNISQACNDLLGHIRFQNPGPVSTTGPKKFSLYMATMLTHGAISIHHFQVQHYLTSCKNLLKNREEEKSSKLKQNLKQLQTLSIDESNDSLNLFDQTLVIDTAAADYGCVGVNHSVIKPLQQQEGDDNITQPRLEEEVSPNLFEIEEDVLSLLERSIEIRRLPHQHNSFDVITIHEELDGQDNNFGFETESFYDDEPALLPDVDVNGLFSDFDKEGPRTPAKRPRFDDLSTAPWDGPNAISTPIRQHQQPDPQQEIVTQPLPPIREQVAAMEIVLEPVEQQMPRRRGRRRRFRRLMIDKETFIKNAVFSVQRHHYGDTMRTSSHADDRALLPSESGFTAHDLLCRPSTKIVSNVLRPSLMRHMQIRPAVNVSFTQDLVQEVEAMEVDPPPEDGQLEYYQPGVASYLPVMVPNETVTSSVPFLEGISDVRDKSMPSMPSLADPSLLTLSVVGTSRHNNSSKDSSRHGDMMSPVPLPAQLPTVAEASVEVSLRSRATMARYGSSFDGRAGSTEVSRGSVAGARQRSSRLQVDQLSPIPAAIDTSSSDNVEEFPAGSQLGDFIAKKIKESNSDTFTFKKLVPPEQCNRLQAAKAFENLLKLASSRKVNLWQDQAYGDIFISFS